MGKLKISKAKKNKKTRGTSGIPNWLLSTLVIIVVLAVLATCASTFIASSGITMRWSTAMSLGDYKVDGNMMSYFYNTTYMNFVNNYSAYISYFSIDTSSDLKDQQFAPEGSYDAMFLGEFDGTWFEYFMSQTKDSVKQLLVYAAKAEELGIELTDEDKTDIEASIDTLIINISSSYGAGLSEDTYLTNVYGKGVKRGDIRKAMELSTLASKVAQKISEDIEAGITDERVTNTYAENKLEFDLVDYYGYSITVYYSEALKAAFPNKSSTDTLTDAEKATVIAKYQELIDEARKNADELAKKTTLDEIRNLAVELEAKDLYDSEYTTAVKSITDAAKKPSETKAEGAEASDYDVIKNKMIAAVIAEVNGGKAEAVNDVVSTEKDGTTTYTIYGISITKEFADAAKTLKNSLFNKVIAVREDNLMKEVNYKAPDKDGNKDPLSVWAFDPVRIVNDAKKFEKGDNADGAAIDATKLSESFTVNVAMIVRPVYRDDTLGRNVAYMLFTKEEAAKKAIDAVAATQKLDKDAFLAIANDSANAAAASTYLEDCIKGTMQSDVFDEWLYNAILFDYTTAPLKMDDGSFMVAYYAGEGKTTAWQYDVKAYIYNKDYTAYEEDMNEEFASSVVINEKVLNRVGN